MTDMICWLIGGLISISIYLMLSPQIMRWLFGIVILSSTINLVILVAGRLYSQNPACIPQGMQAPDALLANPLPQALILTATSALLIFVILSGKKIGRLAGVIFLVLYATYIVWLYL